MLHHYLLTPLAAVLLPALAAQAQTLTNDGATLTVGSGATLYVVGAVQNNAGSTLSNAGTVQLTGDLTNAGTLASGGTLLFSGTANQTFAPGTATVATLVLNNTGATGARTLNLPADLTVGTALTLQSGLLRTAPTATLTLPDGATLSGEGPGQYVQGNLRIVRAAGSGVLDFGHGLTLDRTGLGQVTATRTAGLLTDNVSRGVNFSNAAYKGIDRIWTVETTTAPSAAVPVTLQWLADDDNGLSSFSPAQAWRAAPGSARWGAVGSPAAATVAGSSRSFSFATAALGRLTVSNAANPLPVELTRFTAEPLGADALLRWATASEKNNSHFEVEASADGRTFHRIGQVAGHGSSTQPHEYQFLDPAIARYAASPVYYRLRQVDADGTASYSPVRQVAVVAGPAALALFPNPTTDRTATLTGAQPGALVQVFDAIGRQVLAATADAAGTAALLLPVGHATGVYVVRVGSKALRLTVE
ncbi:T9SS type A sorting domain-containing protein [Hymenobacter sp. DH14]|uniref:T9SS type A sorting domain-containing protein n=1 Tax=Hymenobacter cyanobacteriorum TaxID=2926463 RepID=A0A9X2AJT3_9BACT|nr:T9SS type A sorting domain-containing protein [Hymenobacter cyanobacteriorum]MCI1190105.1 T9SS type A sorting domain-containing protein [Hymenobacter cyanobacteriorum]